MKVFLAPMEGVVDFATRCIYSKLGGYDQFVTEFVRVSQNPVPPSVFLKYCPELRTGGHTLEGIPVFVQLLGSDLENLATSAMTAVDLGAPGIDLNFGCPAKTVNRHDGGATLLKSPERLFSVVSAVRKAVPAHIPVTAKVRLGFDHKDFVKDIAQAAQVGGAFHLTVHARTKVEGYKPPAHWEYIGSMREAVTIPVIANGDIWSVSDYQKCREISGCENIALGRPAIACPDLAHQIKAWVAGKSDDYYSQTWSEVLNQLFLPFIQLSQAYLGDRYALNRGKQWLKLLGRQYKEAQILFEQARTAQTLNQFRHEIEPPSQTQATGNTENVRQSTAWLSADRKPHGWHHGDSATEETSLNP